MSEERERLEGEQEELLRNPIGYGKITYSKKLDMRLYQGTVPFKSGDEVYMIRQDVFSDLIKNCLDLLLQSNTEMSEEMFRMFPDSLHFTEDNEDGEGEVALESLYLDRHFYSHDGNKYAYVRFASLDEFQRTGDLVRTVDYSKGDPIEDIVVERDDMAKQRLRMEGQTLYRGKDGKMYWSDGQDEYEIEDVDEEPFNPIEGLPDIDDWFEDDDDI